MLIEQSSQVKVLNSFFTGAYPVQRTSKISNPQDLANFLSTLTLVTLFNRYKDEHLLCQMNNAQELNCGKLIKRMKECNRIASFLKAKSSRRWV